MMIIKTMRTKFVKIFFLLGGMSGVEEVGRQPEHLIEGRVLIKIIMMIMRVLMILRLYEFLYLRFDEPVL